MDFRRDPFFEEVAPPSMSLFPHMELGGSSAMRGQHHHGNSLALAPFGGMIGAGPLMPFVPSPFSMMSGMMHNMDNMMRSVRGASAGGGGGHCFSSSTTVMQYSSDGRGGQPHVYQATSSTRQGPGGVKETKKAVKDSHSGLQKMAIGHHIGERSHVIERRVNAKTGEKAQNQELINLDESEADVFGEEWKEKAEILNHSSSLMHPSLGHSHRHHLADSRGLPSTSRPGNPEGGGEGRGKRRSRPVSLSGEDDSGCDHPTNKKSPKLIRTKSPPPHVVHKPKPVHPYPPSHPSTRFHVPPSNPSTRFHTDQPTFHSDAPPPPATTGRGGAEGLQGHKKKSGKKTTTFAPGV